MLFIISPSQVAQCPSSWERSLPLSLVMGPTRQATTQRTASSHWVGTHDDAQTYAHTYVHTYDEHTHAHTYAHTYVWRTHTCTHIRTHIRMTNTHTCTHIRTHIWRTHTHKRMHTHAHKHTHIHVRINTRAHNTANTCTHVYLHKFSSVLLAYTPKQPNKQMCTSVYSTLHRKHHATKNR